MDEEPNPTPIKSPRVTRLLESFCTAIRSTRTRILFGLVAGCGLLCLTRSFGQPKPLDAVTAAQGGVVWISSRLPRWRPVASSGSAGQPAAANCFSCHVPGAALTGASIAASRGFEVAPATFQEMFGRIADQQRPTGESQGAIARDPLPPLSPPTHFQDAAYTIPDTTGRAALGILAYRRYLDDPSASAHPPNNLSADRVAVDHLEGGVVQWALTHQASNGSWPAAGIATPNQADVSETASLALLLNDWRARHPDQQAVIQPVIQKAVQWLSSPFTGIADSRAAALRAMALEAVGPAYLAEAAVADLISRRNVADGGWSDREGGPSGAWATGMALVALVRYAPGLALNRQIMDEGQAFLLRTAQPDAKGFYWPSMTGVPMAAIGFAGNLKGLDGKPEIPLEPTAWAVAALALRNSPPCIPSVIPGDATVFAGPDRSLTYTASRVACAGDLKWTIQSPVGSPTCATVTTPPPPIGPVPPTSGASTPGTPPSTTAGSTTTGTTSGPTAGAPGSTTTGAAGTGTTGAAGSTTTGTTGPTTEGFNDDDDDRSGLAGLTGPATDGPPCAGVSGTPCVNNRRNALSAERTSVVLASSATR